MTPFLSVQDAAKHLNVSHQTVRDMIATGRIARKWIVQTTATQVRINPRAFEPDEPTPIHQPATAADVRQIVRDELAAIFRLDRTG
jgi:excisionase family DNA binding protein